MFNEKLRKHFIEDLNLDCSFFDNPSFDGSIIGVTPEGRVVYEFNKMVDELMKDENLSEEEALDFIDYDTMRALNYIEDDIRPVVVYGVEE